MSTLALISLIAFILVVLAIAALSIGWLISGKSKIARGTGGNDPTKSRDKELIEKEQGEKGDKKDL